MKIFNFFADYASNEYLNSKNNQILYSYIFYIYFLNLFEKTNEIFVFSLSLFQYDKKLFKLVRFYSFHENELKKKDLKNVSKNIY